MNRDKDDFYTSDVREAMKVSMSEPAKPFKPLNQKLGTLQPIPGTDRRRRWVRRLWWHVSEEMGMFLWLVAALIAGGLAWLTVDKILGFMR